MSNSAPTYLPVYDRWGIRVFHADCLDVMRGMPDCSVHAVVTDPPYGLEFLGKEWDTFKPGGKRPGFGKPDGSKYRQNLGTPTWSASGNPTCTNCGGDKYRNGPRKCACDAPDFGNHSGDHNRAFQAWCESWARECLRVLKPGGWLLAFGGTRTAHRLACGIEDAGFEIRDEIDSIGGRISWTYGSGFPKSQDTRRAIDVHVCPLPGIHLSNSRQDMPPDAHVCPESPEGEPWAGFGSALKPSHEPIIVARRPLSGTVAQTVLEHGTGALNIATCRVAASAGDTAARASRNGTTQKIAHPAHEGGWTGRDQRVGVESGRWPPNTVFTHSALVDPVTGEIVGDACADGCVAGCGVAELDRQSGVTTSGSRRSGTYGLMGFMGAGEAPMPGVRGDSGGASRFFPCFRWEAKAPAVERPRVNGKAHPTVKPVLLMRWLVRLVCPPRVTFHYCVDCDPVSALQRVDQGVGPCPSCGAALVIGERPGVVLDPFAGTGTTGQAARAEGFPCVLIEQDPDSIPLIVARLDALPKTGAADATGATEGDGPMDLFGLLGGDVA